MIQFGAPGVYIVEASSGIRPITTVATSIAAFVDYFSEGPLDRAVQIFGLTDFERVFGGVDPRSPASYAIEQFFLNGGSSAYVVRAMAHGAPPSDYAVADVVVKAVGAGNNSTFAAASAYQRFGTINPGAWGNQVRVTVTSPYGTIVQAPPFDIVVTRYDSDKRTAKPRIIERYLALSQDATKPRYYVDIVNAASALITVARDSGASAQEVPAINGTVGDNVSTLTPAQIGALNTGTFIVTFNTTVTPAPGARKATLSGLSNSSTLPDLRNAIERAIQTSKPTSPDPVSDPVWDQAFGSITVQLLSDPNPNGTRQFLLRSNRLVPTYDPEETIGISGGVSASLGMPGLANVQEYWLGTGTVTGEIASVTKGVDGQKPTGAELIGSPALQTGMYALETVDLFNILCIPAAAELSSDPEMSAVVGQAIAYCGQRRALMIVDIPPSIESVQAMQDWVDAHTFRDPNAAVYFPRLIIPDKLNNFRDKSLGASGTIAGLYSRTDVARGVWKAPAGTDATLRGLTRLDLKLTDAQNGVLNSLGINCFRVFPIYGDVCWGTRTLVGADAMASEWKYIPIRRLALMIEESLFRGTKWVVFEPNDEPLWAKIRQNVGAFMLQLFRQGAFQGSTPQTAFYVKCDGETTTANDRNLGIVNIEVGFAPLKPAEFVVITIRQIPDIVAAA
jgi:phage tail sheath protein FI